MLDGNNLDVEKRMNVCEWVNEACRIKHFECSNRVKIAI